MTKSLSNKLYLKKQLYGLHMKEEIAVLEYLNFFNKVISELLAVDVKINEEDNALMLLNSLSKLYDYIVTIMLYDKETIILEEIMSTLLSNDIRKKPNQIEYEGSGLVVMGRKRRKEKFGFVEGVSLLSTGRSLKKELQVSTRVVKEGASCEGRHNNERY